MRRISTRARDSRIPLTIRPPLDLPLALGYGLATTIDVPLLSPSGS